MGDDLTQLFAAEEAKRNRPLSSAEKWELWQRHVAPLVAERNTKEACLRKQQRILAGFEAWRASQQS